MKLGADDVNQAIAQLPMESRLEAVPQMSQPGDKDKDKGFRRY